MERTKARLASARARGRNGGCPYKMTAAKLRQAQAGMVLPGTKVGELCTELGINCQRLCHHVDPPMAGSGQTARSCLGTRERLFSMPARTPVGMTLGFTAAPDLDERASTNLACLLRARHQTHVFKFGVARARYHTVCRPVPKATQEGKLASP